MPNPQTPKGFPEIEDELSKADYEILARLAINEDFQHWRKIVEDFQIRRAYLFLRGMELPPDIKDGQSYFRGGHDAHVKSLRIVDGASGALKTFNDDE